MTDVNNTPNAADDRVGEPVDEPRETNDVVGSAGESIAEAERAQREVATDDDDDARFALYAQHAEEADDEFRVPTAEPASAPESAHEVPVVAPVAETVVAERVAEPVAETTVLAPEPVAPFAGETVVAPVAPSRAQPIFVQAPEPPLVKGNRGAAGAIGLVAAIAFAVLFFAASIGIAFVRDGLQPADAANWALDYARSFAFWVPVAVFFLGFWLLGAIINRGRWGHWVVWGLIVAVLSYGGYVVGQLFEAPFWELTAREGRAIAASALFAPGAIVALVLGREITIWFGAWVARRGRRVTEQNDEARREYERTLEAGPQLYQP
ncbi:ABC transporter [uncultured Microbacterium sp.]|uniref:ABC transporter n=1 Tax=uncultured Microbacterium sp. TaxID=191216 RepID=UPI0025D03F33|nr:ABC transporter [uncultured Microbacterium sp.]